jgi:Ca2+-dependent lipid-binding protein
VKRSAKAPGTILPNDHGYLVLVSQDDQIGLALFDDDRTRQQILFDAAKINPAAPEK